MPWNPNAPDTLGMEWAPSRADIATVGSEGAGFAITWEAETTRQLTNLGAALAVTTPGEWTLELYTEADFLTSMTDVIQHSYTSSGGPDHDWTGLWTYPTNNQTPYWQWTTGVPGTAPNANFVVALGPGLGLTSSFLGIRFGGLTIPAGQRLLAIVMLHDREIWNYNDANNISFMEYGYADSSAADHPRITSAERINSQISRQTVEYTYRPRNVLATSDHSGNLVANWAGTNATFGWFFLSYAGPGMQLNSYHMQLVTRYVPERRLAWSTGVPVGGGTTSGQAPAGPLANRFSQIATRGGAPVTINAGTRYVLVVRGPRYSDQPTFVARLQTLLGGPPITGYAGGRVRFSDDGLAVQEVPTLSVGAPLYTGQAGPPTIAPDNDPFPLQGVAAVMGETPVTQSFTVTSAASFGQIVVPVARATYPNPAPLMFRFTDSGGVGLGGQFALTPERWDAIPNPYVLGGRTVKNCRVDLAAGVPLAPGDYFIQVTCADTFALDSGVTPWGVLYLESFTPSIEPAPGFSPVGPYAARNSPMLAVAQPVPLTNFTVTRVPEVLTAPSGCAGAWDRVDLAWDAHALPDPDSFLRYEIERQDGPEGAWERIAHIFDPARVTFSDREQRRGRQAFYRVRVMRVDSGASAWSTAGGVSIRALCCGIGLVSNHTEVPSLFFADTEPIRKYQNLDASGLVTRPTYGRDYQLAFHPTERRGVRFETNLLVHDGASTSGLEHYDTLRELARADLPHVTVLDELGTRLLSAIAVADLEVRPNRYHQSYYASFTAIEIAGAPVVSVIEAPPPDLPIAGTFHMGPHPNDLLDSNFFMGFR